MNIIRTLNFIIHHPLNKNRKISAIVRYLNWQIASMLWDELVFDWVEGARLIVRKGMAGATGNIYCGLHEYADMQFLLDSLDTGDLFVDIGANVGSYTVLASVARAAHVIAIEPDPTSAAYLRNNVAINNVGKRVVLHELALGSSDSTIEFTQGLDTLNRPAVPGDRATRRVLQTTLDALLGDLSPTLIKIDVEGYETKVLQGAQKTLRNQKLKAIVIETVDKAGAAILSSHGFKKTYYNPENKTFCNHPRYNSNNSLYVRQLTADFESF